MVTHHDKSTRCACAGLVMAFVALLATSAAADDAKRFTMGLDLNGSHLEGWPLSWSSSQVHLLSRDGRWLSFAPDKAQRATRLSESFRGYSVNEVRSQLQREFGKQLDTSSTAHFVVAFPRGQRDLWAAKFEDLYRAFVHYFNRRGIPLSEPEFPLVAIVWPSQADFMRYAQQDNAPSNSNVLGYYSPRTNRIALFDTGKGPGDLNSTADTIIHEATHQTAFNTGLHNRFSATPRWVVEGMATMFEARGVWNSKAYTTQGDRINRGRLKQFQQLPETRQAATLVDLVGSDRLFQQNVNLAYAEAWALSFFLNETQSQRYGQYLRVVVARPQSGEYSSAQRVKDFTGVFGDLALLDSHFQKFMKERLAEVR
ncbi:MAG: DUF1570 domain-containing protein [Planctomycetes bacterium]|nr:DUF1570 domain-containing protein [Planctomycetota bacterium]